MTAGADVVLGVRSRRQRFAEHVVAWYTKFRYGIDDPLCGMKAERMSVFNALGNFDSFGSVDTELVLFAVKAGCPFSQLPFEVRERRGSSRFGRVLAGNLKILRAMAITVWH
jgi:hypothetical protein